MKNKTLDEIKIFATNLLRERYKPHMESTITVDEVEDSCGIRAHLTNGRVLRVEIDEVIP